MKALICAGCSAVSRTNQHNGYELNMPSEAPMMRVVIMVMAAFPASGSNDAATFVS